MDIFDYLFGDKIFVEPPAHPSDTSGGSGSEADPFHSVTTALQGAQPGDTVVLREGRYIESVDVSHVHGSPNDCIMVRPAWGENATIDSIIWQLKRPNPPEWEWILGKPGTGEYVWSHAADVPDLPDPVRQGSFVHQGRHTRLISYSQHDDLFATGQIFPKDLTTGRAVWERRKVDGVITYRHTGTYRPCVYMGPGIWFGRDEDDQVDKLHIRLSATTHHIDGWPPYEGETDPNELELALSAVGSNALRLTDCSHIVFKDLTLRYGDEQTVQLGRCNDIVFDGVRIMSTRRALRVANDGGTSTRITLRNCDIDGGLPTWYFRTDRKDDYFFGPDDADAINPVITHNGLGKATSDALLSSGTGTSHFTVEYCKIANGHDLIVFGDHARFHHNWVTNFNDDCIFIAGDEGAGDDLRIYQNVFTQCLTGISFDSDPPGKTMYYRNLVDLRLPTLGIRPTVAGDTEHSLRQANFYKDGLVHGTFDMWHNTFLIRDAGATSTDLRDLVVAGYGVYKQLQKKLNPAGTEVLDHQPRRSFNNIFVAVYTRLDKVKPIAFLPPKNLNGPTDGNGYWLVIPGGDHPEEEGAERDRFMVSKTSYDPAETRDFTFFRTLEDYNAAHAPHEDHGRLGNPSFKFIAEGGGPTDHDDFRLLDHGPNNRRGPMPYDLWWIDAWTIGFTVVPPQVRGCYPTEQAPGFSPWGDGRLHVGPGGNEIFPRL